MGSVRRLLQHLVSSAIGYSLDMRDHVNGKLQIARGILPIVALLTSLLLAPLLFSLLTALLLTTLLLAGLTFASLLLATLLTALLD
jgi:hypothetical protein